ncbi:nucleotidyltransferase domain-containing protein [Dehalococcoidia bacterium]|nr:nucleotidyltransferase domain-containing protein [Dehalococcoidia bacterium]MCL0069755.1 nucleotidyltransferase domain-containing protein [Dehalococcoidia bacterium]MCL0097513.1 nucleotidyltransferase domain-containing protein [Dehalococcoidia bacterium]
MARTAAELTVEELEVYRRAARRRKWREPQERRRRAWVLARRAADLLRERFRARRVVVFGSLVHEACFTPWSDVDLAAWGLRPEDTFRALGAVQYLDADIEVNLIDVATCSPSLLAVIELEGVEV